MRARGVGASVPGARVLHPGAVRPKPYAGVGALPIVRPAGSRERSSRPERPTPDARDPWPSSASAPSIPPSVASAAEPRPVARLLALLARERAEVGVVTVYAALVGVLGLALPLGVQAIVGLVSGGMLLQPVVVLIGFVVLGTLAAGVVQVLQLAAVERMQQRIFARLALNWSVRLPRVQREALQGADLPEVTNRFFEIISIQKGLAKLLTEGIAALLGIAAGLLLLTLYHPAFSIAGVLFFASLALLLWLTGRGGLTTSLAESTSKYRVAHWLQEIARRVTTLQLAGASRLPLGRMDDEVAGYLELRQAHFRVLVRQSMAAVVFKTLITGGLLVLGTTLVVRRQITLGQFVASELVVVGMLGGIEKLILSLTTVYDVLTASEKAGHVDDLAVHTPHGRTPLPERPPRGRALAVRDLAYRYPGTVHPALDGLAFELQPGEVVAVTGAEGAGESTLLQLLAGLLPGYEGIVTLDGVSLRDVDAAALRREVALVEPIAELLDATLEENVTLGRPHVTPDDVRWALDVAGLSTTVHALPDGLDTRIGGGVRLPSHVQRRLALARAVAGRPGLLMFDEFFHHLEPRARRETLARLLAPDATWTLLAASHEPAYLASCDRIYLLDEGRVVRAGTLAELLGEPAFAGLLRASDPLPARVAATAPPSHASIAGTD